jgi:hypothetical protein
MYEGPVRPDLCRGVFVRDRKRGSHCVVVVGVVGVVAAVQLSDVCHRCET